MHKLLYLNNFVCYRISLLSCLSYDFWQRDSFVEFCKHMHQYIVTLLDLLLRFNDLIRISNLYFLAIKKSFWHQNEWSDIFFKYNREHFDSAWKKDLI